MRFLVLLAACLLAGCDIELNMPAAATPTAPGAVSVTNTNTNTATQDRADTGTSSPTTPSGGTPGSPTTGALPLPAYGESVTRDYAALYPAQVTNSCQVTHGESAWQFLDGLIRTLQARDARWGYLCKDASCANKARDVVAYRASTGDTGIWIVDVLGSHCPGPGDSPTQVRWGVLPFETVRRWSGTR